MKIKSLLLVGGVVLAGLPVFAQGNEATQARLINALPQSQGISVKIGATQVFDGVKSGDITPYKMIPEQDDKTVIIQNGSQQLKTTEQFDFDDNDSNYTVLVTPNPDDNNPKVVVLESDREDVDADEVEINVINASPAHDSIKIRLNDDVKERGVDYADTGDADVKPGVYNLAVLDASGNDTVIASRSVTLTGGTAVTVLLTAENQVKIINDMSPQQDLAASGMNANDTTTTGTPSAATMTTATQQTATMTSPAMSM